MTYSRFPTFGAALAVACALAGTQAAATHQFGAALVPSVDADGYLTIDAKSFWHWKYETSDYQMPFVGGLDPNTNPNEFRDTYFVSAQLQDVQLFFPRESFSTPVPPSTPGSYDVLDVRRLELSQSFGGFALSRPGLYTIEWIQCCTVSSLVSPENDKYLSARSTIYWDGVNATTPIVFDLENIQPIVVRGEDYSDNLNAIGGPGLTLTYGVETSVVSGRSTVVDKTGYSISSDGTINISAAQTLDGRYGPAGGDSLFADKAIQGRITATDASGQVMGSVEFFNSLHGADATDPVGEVPTVGDIVVSAAVGDLISQTVAATHPSQKAVTLSLTNFVGSGGVLPGNAVFDPATGRFTWDSTGFAPGRYMATIQGFADSPRYSSEPYLFGALDNGTITIDLTAAVAAVPLPASALLLMGGVGALGALRRRRRAIAV